MIFECRARQIRNNSKSFITTETTELVKNVTFEETIVTSGQEGNKLMRKFISNPVTRSIFDDSKQPEGSKLRDYDIKSKSKMDKHSNSEKVDTTGFQISKELVIPKAIPKEEAIEEMSEEELLRQYDDISNKLKQSHIKLERRV